jgi:hypothetical protein
VLVAHLLLNRWVFRSGTPIAFECAQASADVAFVEEVDRMLEASFWSNFPLRLHLTSRFRDVEVPVVKKLSILLVDEERQAVTDHFGVALVASVVVSEEQLRKDQIPTGRSADSLSATRA